jgi:predicted metal-dependent hydrolase
MANEMMGLFSNISPEQRQQQYLQQQMVSPEALGQQSLLNRGVSMMSNAGARIGGVGARMLGGVLPGEEKAAAISSMFKNIQAQGGEPSEQMFELSKQLGAAGYGNEAMQALDKANALKNTSITQRTATAQARSAETSADVEEKTAPDKITLSGLDVDYKTANIASVKAQTDSVLASTSRSQQLLPYEIQEKQAVVDKMEQELAERKDLAPLEKQELQGRIKAARFNLQQQQAQAPMVLAKLKAEAEAVMNDKKLRTQLQALPENASNDDYMKVMRKYGDPNKVLAAITRTETQKAADAAKIEAAKIRADAKLAQMPKDVAEYVGNISLIDSSDKKLDKYIDVLENDKVNFGVGGRVSAYFDSFGKPSEKTLLAAQIDREFRQQANLILMAAKGVQTEGDAQRAYQQIIGSLEKWSNVGVKQALQDIKAWQQEIKKMNQAKIGARGYAEYAKGKGADLDMSQWDK